jgi:lipopolysaccharide assembly protein A
MRIITYLVLLLLVLIGITFAALNASPVLINYYVGSSKLPLSLLLVLSLVLGIVLGMLISVLPYLRLHNKNRRLRQRLKVVEEELTNLRALPLRDEH